MEGQRLHAGLVLVHGAGKEPSGYYRGFMDAISRHLGVQPPVLPAWWADLCNLGADVKGESAGSAAPALSKEAQAFRNAYLRELGVGGKAGGPDSDGRAGVRSVGGTLISLADTANDVVQYFYNPRLRAAVQGRLLDKLSEASAKFDRAILVSHSLGSVIAYDVLRQHASEFSIHTWYTTGCPLGRLARLGRVTTNLGQISEGTLPGWRNVYDDTDIVASALSQVFAFPLADVRVDNGPGVLNSHNYWGNLSVAAMVGEELRQRYLRVPPAAQEAPATARPRRPLVRR